MEKVLWELLSGRLVAIVRGVGPEEIVDTARALAAGGIRALEITFDHTRADGAARTLESIRLLKERMGGELLLGANRQLFSHIPLCTK